MDHTLLVSFLEGITPAQEYCRAIAREVDECEEGIRSSDNIGYIHIGGGPLTIITRAHIKRFLRCMLDESIPWAAANYTGDCLIMSDDFEFDDEVVTEAVQFIADDSRAPTADETRAALASIA